MMSFAKRGAVIFGCLLSMIITGCSTSIENEFSKHNRIYFFFSGIGIDKNTGQDGISPAADLLIVESEGHYGLIDSGHRFDQTITDSDGVEYYVPNIDEEEEILSNTRKDYYYI